MLKVGEGCRWLVQSWFGQKSASASYRNALMVNLNFQQNQVIIWFFVHLYLYCNHICISFIIVFLFLLFWYLNLPNRNLVCINRNAMVDLVNLNIQWNLVIISLSVYWYFFRNCICICMSNSIVIVFVFVFVFVLLL